jgi:exodeoxyribonuclease VII large subunit
MLLLNMELSPMTSSPLFSVSQFLATVNQSLEYSFTAIQVEGEVSSFKVNQGKFVFFDIKDESGSVGCFMTVWQLRTPIEDGMKIIVTATPKVTPWGKFSLTVQNLRPSGEGSLKKSFELLRSKLEKEGLFALERKRPLPSIPARVGVISSMQSAGYADFCKLLNDRWGGLDVQVAHTQVQGEAAADQMVRAVEYFNLQADPVEVIVLIRGGGSADDLAAFNDEKLVRAVAASRIPTMVGVGHEVDVSLADLVADKRAATPSNAAQLLVPDKREVIRAQQSQLRAVIGRTERAVDESRLEVKQRLGHAITAALNHVLWHEQTLQRSLAQLRAYDPAAVLARGVCNRAWSS